MIKYQLKINRNTTFKFGKTKHHKKVVKIMEDIWQRGKKSKKLKTSKETQ